MATEVWITANINALLKAALAKRTKKEGLMHSILALALTDPEFLKRAKAFNNYLGNQGVANLEKRGL